jgi:hypothetical protein
MPARKPRLTLAALRQKRDQNYRLSEKLRLKDAAAIRRFVDDAGIALLFPVQGMPMPNIYHAVAGFEKAMTAKHDDPAISLTWTTKDSALDKRWWFYAKLLRGKATLLSLDMLAVFYALSENFDNDAEDYLSEYEAGTLSADAKNIYEALLTHGAMHAIEIKRKAGLYGDTLKTRFDRALTELQTGLKVMPVGVAEAGAWRYAFVYQIVSRWLPEIPKRAEAYTRSSARVAILRRHLRNAVYGSAREFAKIYGWKPAEVDKALAELHEAGDADVAAFPDEIKGEVWLYRGT